jgi:hypothetical protein
MSSGSRMPSADLLGVAGRLAGLTAATGSSGAAFVAGTGDKSGAGS